MAAFSLLSEIPRTQIEWVVERGELHELPAGTVFFKKGDEINKLFLVLEGMTSFRIEQNGQYKELGGLKKGDISGALPYSRAQSVMAEGSAVIDTRVFMLDKSYFRNLVCECYELTEVLVHQMTDRVRNATRKQQQDEKLMALGKISAGLAHELNNPASAIARSSELLQKHLSSVPGDFKKVTSMDITDEAVDFINDLLYSKIGNGINKSESLMQRTEREDDLTDWLEDNGYGDYYMLSETLAEYGFCMDDLARIREKTSAEGFPHILEWGESMLTTEKMVGEIKEASNRISTLVTSVKSYSHMDKNNEQEPTNVHIGIHNTLTILNHKLKKNKVKLVEELDPSLPTINASPGELNQVWTNIIDNAIDAMDGGGTLSIITQKIGNNVNVQIVDSGPGIPEEIQTRIFEPFYTTKDVGKGTGLGLDVVRRIVEGHNGSIKVTSEPGNTNFEFCFPINTKG